ncbi:MAG TPA: KGG domain-containing protein [Chroococcales cyanobacterium]
MAKEKAKKGELTVREAGKKGGEKVKAEYGPEFYSEIGHKGGQKVKELIQKAKQDMSAQEKKK